MRPYLIAIDPSLTCSGWALFSLKANKPVAAGIIEPPGADYALESRLQTLQNTVKETFEMFNLSDKDYLLCEGPAHLVLNPDSALKVERVRSIFETMARTHGLQVPGRLNPRTVQTELLGFKGPQVARVHVKEAAREVVSRLFSKELKEVTFFGCDKKKQIPQDIVDALLIGSLACSRVNSSLKQKINVQEMFQPKQKKASQGRARWSESDLKQLKKRRS